MLPALRLAPEARTLLLLAILVVLALHFADVSTLLYDYLTAW